MKKSKTVRTLIVAGCVAGSPGCVSGPQPRPLPPPAECPPGAAAAHKRFGLFPGDVHGVLFLPFDKRPRIVPVREGQKVRAEIIGPWDRLPEETTFDGRLHLGDERVYGRFTAAHLPSGESVPVCLEVMTLGEPMRGTGVEPGSTSTQALVISSVSVQVVERFK
ncbi:hypothetical protein ACN28E_41800 [Archangium lansingense]|uniref:hypothetical protein n=1 Tax=Archangium lansingense TaxID=2995310 RepID=UPI003B812171